MLRGAVRHRVVQGKPGAAVVPRRRSACVRMQFSKNRQLSSRLRHIRSVAEQRLFCVITRSARTRTSERRPLRAGKRQGQHRVPRAMGREENRKSPTYASLGPASDAASVGRRHRSVRARAWRGLRGSLRECRSWGKGPVRSARHRRRACSRTRSCPPQSERRPGAAGQSIPLGGPESEHPVRQACAGGRRLAQAWNEGRWLADRQRSAATGTTTRHTALPDPAAVSSIPRGVPARRELLPYRRLACTGRHRGCGVGARSLHGAVVCRRPGTGAVHAGHLVEHGR